MQTQIRKLETARDMMDFLKEKYNHPSTESMQKLMDEFAMIRLNEEVTATISEINRIKEEITYRKQS